MAQDSPPSNRNRMDSIQGARALAAISVMLMHAANLMRVPHFSGHIGMDRFFDWGYVGVDFFFVLSGFIITYVHFGDLGRPGRIAHYLWRRLTRIYPVYWAILLLAMGVVGVARTTGGSAQSIGLNWEDVPGTVLLFMTGGEPRYIGVAWSLKFEVLFYLAFCLPLWNLRWGTGVFVLWGGLILASAGQGLPFELPLNLGHPHCLEFLLGVACGAAARKCLWRCSLWHLGLAIAALVWAVHFEVYGPLEQHGATGRVLLGLASAAILFVLSALENRGAIATPRWLAFLGSVSYSLYLCHCLTINTTYSVLLRLGLYHRLPEAVVYGLALGCALTAACVIGLTVELPLIEVFKRCQPGFTRRTGTQDGAQITGPASAHR